MADPSVPPSPESIKEAAAKMLRQLEHQPHPAWIEKNWRVYRLVMRAAHALGFCWPEVMRPDGDVVFWCQWCGLRGRR